MQASSTDNPKGQKALNACVTWNFRSTRSEPVTAAVAGFSSAAWPEFEPPFTAAGTSPMPPGHVGFSPGLADKDQPFGIKSALVFLPSLAPAGDVGAILLAGVQALF